ncbi:MAG: hypothetical protein HYV08_07560 [Deltaproteobacteria bacterium]|nr:hypothetical protein [Deltaproteobacteria bacterium]MBI3076308.1 hypothetical protein [Deltaproteobacteria bacterium]
MGVWVQVCRSRGLWIALLALGVGGCASRDELAAREREIVQVRTTLTQAQAEGRALREQLEGARRQLQAAVTERDALQAQVVELGALRREHEVAIRTGAELQARVQAVESRLQALERENDRLKVVLTEREDELKEARQTVETLRAQVGQLARSLRETTEALKTKTEGLQAETRRAEALGHKTTELEQRLGTARDRNEALDRRVKELEAGEQRLRVEIEVFQARIRQLTEALKALVDVLGRGRQEERSGR